MHLESLGLLVFDGHAAISVGQRLLLYLALRSLTTDNRTTGRVWCHSTKTILVLVSLVFNVIAKIVRRHAVNLFGSELTLLLLSLTVPLLLSSSNILLRNLLPICIDLHKWTIIWRHRAPLRIYPVIVLRSLNMRIVLMLSHPFLLRRLLLHLLLLLLRIIVALLLSILLLLLLRSNTPALRVLLLLRLLLLRVLVRLLSLMLLLSSRLELLIIHNGCGSFLELFLFLLAARLRVRVAISVLLAFIKSFVLSISMSL